MNPPSPRLRWAGRMNRMQTDHMRKNEPFSMLPLLTGMKTMKSFCLSWLVLTGAATAVSGQPFRTDINPALTYYQAFNVAPDYSQEDRDYLFTNEWRNQK